MTTNVVTDFKSTLIKSLTATTVEIDSSYFADPGQYDSLITQLGTEFHTFLVFDDGVNIETMKVTTDGVNLLLERGLCDQETFGFGIDTCVEASNSTLDECATGTTTTTTTTAPPEPECTCDIGELLDGLGDCDTLLGTDRVLVKRANGNYCWLPITEFCALVDFCESL